MDLKAANPSGQVHVTLVCMSSGVEHVCEFTERGSWPVKKDQDEQHSEPCAGNRSGPVVFRHRHTFVTYGDFGGSLSYQLLTQSNIIVTRSGGRVGLFIQEESKEEEHPRTLVKFCFCVLKGVVVVL